MNAHCLREPEIVFFVWNNGVVAKKFVFCDEKLKRQVTVEASHNAARLFFVLLMGMAAFERSKETLASFCELLVRLMFGTGS